jgi:hypothetical protein
MGYRIRVVPEVEAWLRELRESDPGSAGLVDEAVDALREEGAGLGPPLVVAAPAHETRHDPDRTYRQFEMLTRMRRAVADAATTRKRLELQMQQLEEEASRLAQQRAKASQIGRDDLAAKALARLHDLQAQLKELSRQHAEALASEERLFTESRQLQSAVDALRIRQEAIEAVEAVEAANPPKLSELRPGAPESAAIRILFAVKPPDTAILLAAGTERDWLHAWYAEMILRCRGRYERDQGGAG